MMKITALGTGNASAKKYYNTCFIIDTDVSPILVDGGGGNQILTQIDKTGHQLKDFHYGILTHAHTDHLFGMIWVLRMIAQLMLSKKYDGIFTLYCHDELNTLIHFLTEKILAKSQFNLIDKKIIIQTVHNNEIIKINNIEFKFFDILSTKLKQYGFIIEKNNKKLVFSGDEPLSEDCKILAKNATYLICEAFCLSTETDKFHPYEKHHSTVLDECNLAESLNIKNLILWHTEDSHIGNRKELYMAEGKKVFSGNLLIPDDLEEFYLNF